MPTSVRERLRLACPTIVDETMADLALDVPAAEPFALHMPTAISIGSVSKSVWGGLRIGWIRARPHSWNVSRGPAPRRTWAPPSSNNSPQPCS